jgi:membrane associated rhomboid family serine protease
MIPIRDENPTNSRAILTIILIILNIFFYLASGSSSYRKYTYYKYGVIPRLLLTCGDEQQYQKVWRAMKQQKPPSLHSFKSYNEFNAARGEWQRTMRIFQALENEDGKLAHRRELLTIFTSLFLHGGWLHLFSNMLFLWVFGKNIEDATGRLRFIIFYFCCGVIATLVHVAVSPQSVVPLIGASGAIAGVLGAYLLLYPRAEITTLVPIPPFILPIELPAYAFLGYWIVLQFISGLPSLGRLGGGVAWFAHIGGFFTGLLLIVLFKRREVKYFQRGLPEEIEEKEKPASDEEDEKEEES